MKFLQEELEGLPPVLAQSALGELESIVRFLKLKMPEATPKECQMLCSRIAATLQILARFKSELASS